MNDRIGALAAGLLRVPPLDGRDLRGPFDIVGDVQGCRAELTDLLARLGYERHSGAWRHPDGRRLVFVGDLIDLGPDSAGTLRLVMELVRDGAALSVAGNHEADRLRNLVQILRGERSVEDIPSGWARRTLSQLLAGTPRETDEYMEFLAELPPQILLDNGRLVIAHAGLPAALIGVDSLEARVHALFGEPDPTPVGKPEGWITDYHGPLMVHGHKTFAEVWRAGSVIGVDTGCVFGNRLAALRYPEMTVTSVAAHAVHLRSNLPVSPVPGPASVTAARGERTLR